MFLSASLQADLTYKQEATLSSFKSELDAKEMAAKFVQAAEGDDNLQVMDVKYEQEKLGDNFTAYKAIITCHVSQLDVDLMRVQLKMVQNINAAASKNK